MSQSRVVLLGTSVQLRAIVPDAQRPKPRRGSRALLFRVALRPDLYGCEGRIRTGGAFRRQVMSLVSYQLLTTSQYWCPHGESNPRFLP